MPTCELPAGTAFTGARKLLIGGLCFCNLAAAAEPDELLAEPLAAAFGAQPSVWGLRLSPSGTMISLMQVNGAGQTVVTVLDLEAGSFEAVMGNEPDEFDITWCDWANDTRLLCGAMFYEIFNDTVIPVTRIVGVNTDGSELQALAQEESRGLRTQYLDRVIDWLPDDSEHVLIQVPTGVGYSLGRLDIYTGRVADEERRSSDIYSWLTDGHGTARLYREILDNVAEWFVRDDPESDWALLHEAALTDVEDNFSPIGFGEDRNVLYFMDSLDGRVALYSMDLANERERSLVYSHPSLDIANVYRYGRYKRLAAVAYFDERPQLHFFDEKLEAIHDGVQSVLPGQIVSIVDEDWSQRYYLFFAGSPTSAGFYYRYDSEEQVLLRLFPAYGSLGDRELAEVQAVTYPAPDGTPIPAYLTLPSENADGPVPAVVLPHGGPSSRDVWSYDFLAQFLAAEGYAVLQSNYRGSAGYGSDWRGRGGFQDWRVAIDDIVAGVDYLVDSGVASAGELCALGWSYGGYAALLSVLEEPDAFDCVVSIAGVTDPRDLGLAARRNFLGGFATQTFIGMDRDELRRASAVDRADEIEVPVLLFHPRNDLNVPFRQSRQLARALERADADVEFIEYEHAEHSIRPQRYRIDMLSRIGSFLDAHIGR